MFIFHDNKDNMTDTLNAPASPDAFRATTPDFMLFSSRSIILATFLGSPLVGGYLLSRNSLRLGNTSRAWTELAVATLGTLGLLVFAFASDETNAVSKALGHVSAIVGIFIVATYTSQTQSAAIGAHTSAGGKLESGWKAFGIALIGLFIMFALAMVLVAVVGNTENV
jgi:hypothetical protein